jgi:thiol-disulfide isomerase/thioredoxin
MVTFYQKPGCGLCREIERPLMAYAAQYGVQVRIVNIDEDKVAWERYWDKIPVIEIDAQTILYEPISHRALRDAIRGAGKTSKT